MIPIPRYSQGYLFQNSSEDLERVRCIACVGYNGGPYDTGQFARGYFAAAHQLFLWEVSAPCVQIDKLPIEARSALRISIDLKVYPILYCYRHGIELGLKHLLFQLPRFFNQPLTPNQLHGHSLERWWSELLPHLNRLRTENVRAATADPQVPWFLDQLLHPDDLANIGSIINDVHGLDESSTTFRYALDRTGNIPLGDKRHFILDKVFWLMLPVSVWFEEMFHHSDILAGPPPGLEPNWLHLLEPLRSLPEGQDSTQS